MLEELLDDDGQPFPALPKDDTSPATGQLVPLEDVLGLITRYELWVIPKDELAAAVQKLAAA